MVLHRWVIGWTTAYTTTSGSEVAVPVGGWEAANPAATKGRGWGEFRGKLGQGNMGLGIQYTNDVNGTPTNLRVSSLESTEGVSNPSGTPTTVDLDGAKFVRPVVFVKSGDGAIAGGGISGIVELWG